MTWSPTAARSISPTRARAERVSAIRACPSPRRAFLLCPLGRPSLLYRFARAAIAVPSTGSCVTLRTTVRAKSVVRRASESERSRSFDASPALAWAIAAACAGAPWTATGFRLGHPNTPRAGSWLHPYCSIAGLRLLVRPALLSSIADRRQRKPRRTSRKSPGRDRDRAARLGTVTRERGRRVTLLPRRLFHAARRKSLK
jgi:hypothetical protein